MSIDIKNRGEAFALWMHGLSKLGDHGWQTMTPRQIIILAELYQSGQILSCADVARNTGIPKVATWRAINAIKRQGFIYDIKHTTDARCSAYGRTQKGQDFIITMADEVLNYLKEKSREH